MAAVTHDHPLAAREALDPADLAGETVLLASNSEWTEALTRYLRPRENGIIIVPDIRDMHALPVLLSVENCVGLTPGHLRRYYEEMYGDRFAFLKLEGLDVRISIAAVWKKGNRKNALRPYAEVLRRVVKEQNRPPSS